MTRRDTIILASLLNAGLLGLLFFTATREEDVSTSYSPAVQELALGETKLESKQEEVPPADEMSLQEPDEIDQALKEFMPDEKIANAPSEIDQEFNPQTSVSAPKKEEAVKESKTSYNNVVEVTVKRGDALEKIARANNSTIQAIKEENNLKSDSLKVGQVLKIPVGIKAAKTEKKFASNDKVQEPETNGEPVYYTVKTGDNPWKIAKQFKVKFEDILKLNNMSEDKAKNLKVGDKIRVK